MTDLLAEIGLSRSSLVRASVGIVVAVVVLGALAAVIRDPVTAAARGLVSDLGVPGLVASVAVMESVPFVGFQFGLFFGWAGGIGAAPLLFGTWVGAMLASVAVFTLGRAMRSRPALVEWAERSRAAGWLRRHGAKAIGVAAVAPVPYAVATFVAGVIGVSYRNLLLGASFRGIKIALMLAAIAAGWGAS